MKYHLPKLSLRLNLAWRWQNPAPRLVPRNTERTGVHQQRFFCACVLMVGCAEALRRAVFCDGRTNSVQSASLLVGPNGGSPLIHRRRLHYA